MNIFRFEFRPRFFLVVAIALPTAACGGKAVMDDGAGGSATTTTTGTATTTSTATTSTATTTSSGTTSAPTCDGLAAAYAEQLALAKTCSPLVNTNQCTELVEEKAACSCPVYVNPVNTAAFAALANIKSQYQGLGCYNGMPCPSCIMPQGGGCSEAGVCQTYGQD